MDSNTSRMDSNNARLLALPKELRYNIIEHLLDDIFPAPNAQAPYVLPRDEPKSDTLPYIELLLVNKQTSEDVAYIFETNYLSHVTFRFSDLAKLCDFHQSIMQSRPLLRDMGFKLRTTPRETSIIGWTDALLRQNQQIGNHVQIMVGASGELSEDEGGSLTRLLGVYNGSMPPVSAGGLCGSRRRIRGLGITHTLYTRATPTAIRVKISLRMVNRRSAYLLVEGRISDLDFGQMQEAIEDGADGH